jgi:hypothetical protein
VSDLRQLFDDSIRFEIELWNAVDARLQPGEALTSPIDGIGDLRETFMPGLSRSAISPGRRRVKSPPTGLRGDSSSF